MKILAAGCLHNDATLIRGLADKAEKENVDLVVLCGDLTLGEQSTDYIVGPFKQRGKQVLLVPGNHETLATADFLAKKYSAVNLHGYSYQLGDIGFFGCGGANCGVFQLSEDEIHATLHKAHSQLGDVKKKVMVTHVHPAETMMERFSQFVKGSTGLTSAIASLRPDLLLCSHVHEASGIEEMLGTTRVVNVSKQGRIIEL